MGTAMQRNRDHFGAPLSIGTSSYWYDFAGYDSAPLPALRGDHCADVVIVGGGFTGLSAALHLSEAFPEHRILLLEAARVGYGASGQNSGLLLPFINGAVRIVEDLLRQGRVEEARQVHRETSAGIGIIEGLIAEHELDCEWEQVGSMRTALTPRHERQLERERQMYAALGIEAEWVQAAALRPRVDPEKYRGALCIGSGAMLHPGKLVREVLALIRARGVEVHEESPVIEIMPGASVTVRTAAACVRAPALFLATNAYTAQLGMFRRRILPVHCYSIATEPLSDAQLEGLEWQDRRFFIDPRAFFELFRLTRDNRIIHNGGNAFYCWGGAVMDGAGHPDYVRLERALHQTFPALGPISITHRWVGHVGFTLDMTPTLGRLGTARNVFFAGGYSGHGVPPAFLAGRLLRDLYAGEPLPSAVGFVRDRRLPPSAPEPLNSLGFALLKRYLRWADSR